MHSLALQPATATPSALPRPASDLADADIVHEIIRGNREMFEVIVRRYNQQLYRVGMAYLRNHALTEDAMQNAYLKAFLNLARFQGKSGFATWLTRILINECLMLLRTQKRTTMESIHDGEDRSDIEPFVLPAATDALQRDELKTLLESALQELPRAHRTVYLLREVQHLTTAEAARTLGMSRANVKVCLHRAREGLKSQLLKTAAGVELFNYPARFCDPFTASVMQAVRGMP